MIKLKINNKNIEVSEDTSILKAAQSCGVEVPALCWHEELEHFTSCMLCLVKDVKSGKLIPSCSVSATDGLEIITDDDEVKEARQTALELLLSEHVGDCEAPCQIACPAHMDIPKMNRLIAEGKFEEALENVIEDIAMPSVLGRICPAPCEGACKRKAIDEPVSICLLKRFVGDEVGNEVFANLKPAHLNKKKIAIIGSGPAGLAAAFYLQLRGYDCTIFEKENQLGGLLRTAIDEDKLPQKVLDSEINNILSVGIKTETGVSIDSEKFKDLQKESDAVIVAIGSDVIISDWNLNTNPKGIEILKNTYETNVKGVFAIGNALRASRLAVRSVGQGKEVAFAVDQFLEGKKVVGEKRIFNSKFGRLIKEEFSEYLKESVTTKRLYPEKTLKSGFSSEEAKKEAERCLHCDCRKIDNCKLRDLSDEYKAVQKRFAFSERKPVRKYFNHDLVVYEPQKCIKCGICVRLTEKHQEKFGFTFIGRGFDVEIGVPFGEDIKAGLTDTAKTVAEACPTGALALKGAPSATSGISPKVGENKK